MSELTKDDLRIIAECLDVVRRQCDKESLAKVYGVMLKVDALLAKTDEPEKSDSRCRLEH